MPNTHLNFPYDAEIFNLSWKTTPDLVLTTMIESGAVQQDAEIERLIANGANYFTTPYYDVLTGTEDVYNGVDSFTGNSLTGGSYAGVVYGRMASWKAKSFIKDFNSGADPMAQIVDGVATFWIKARQTRLIKIVEAVFGITSDPEWNLHKTNIAAVGNVQSEKLTVTGGASGAGTAKLTATVAGLTGSPKVIDVTIGAGDTTPTLVATAIRSALTADTAFAAIFTIGGTGADVIVTKKALASFDSTLALSLAANGTGVTAGASVDNTTASTVGDTNLIGATSVNDMAVKANGDNAGQYSLAIMHSTVANRLAKLQLLEYAKYTNASGIQVRLPIAQVNGYTVIVNDNVPVVASSVADYNEYTTYLLGNGSIRYAQAPVDVPSEMDRDPDTNGGVDMIYTRLREVLVPYGFSFIGNTTTDVGVPDSVLTASASYELFAPAKSIFMAKLVTNG